MHFSFIDHYDSFSFNVLDWLVRAGIAQNKIHCINYDDTASIERLKTNLTPLIISPGPGRPDDYPETLTLLRLALTKGTPIFGICLGHQMIGHLAGGTISKAQDPWHGTRSEVKIIQNDWLTSGLPNKFQVVSYNSLIVDTSAIDRSKWSSLGFDQHNQLMILSHATLPVGSVQFHPESFASDDISILAKNFLKRAVC